MNRRHAVAGLATIAGLAAASPTRAQAPSGSESTFDRIRRTKVMRVAGLMGEEPYFSKNLASGQWSGFCIAFARDIARQLGAEIEVVESTWGNSVLDLQANKVDISFGLNPTPQRALVIDFSRPLFHNAFVVVTRKEFKPATWEDLNKPEVRIAVDIGSSHETIARRFAGRATITGFRTRDEAILAAASGRADCFVATIILGLTSLKKNPQLGNFVMPLPAVRSAVSAGMRIEPDKRFRDFVSTWADFNGGLGQTREWIVEAMTLVGLSASDIPPEVVF